MIWWWALPFAECWWPLFSKLLQFTKFCLSLSHVAQILLRTKLELCLDFLVAAGSLKLTILCSILNLATQLSLIQGRYCQIDLLSLNILEVIGPEMCCCRWEPLLFEVRFYIFSFSVFDKLNFVFSEHLECFIVGILWDLLDFVHHDILSFFLNIFTYLVVGHGQSKPTVDTERGHRLLPLTKSSLGINVDLLLIDCLPLTSPWPSRTLASLLLELGNWLLRADVLIYRVLWCPLTKLWLRMTVGVQ